MPIEENYHRVRAAVRELGCRDSLSVIWAYCQYLQVNDFEMPGDIEVHREFLGAELPQALLAEFTLEQLAREVIRHADIEPRRGRTLRRWDTLAGIVKDLRDVEREIYAAFNVGNHIWHELRRISHQQFVWQQLRLHWRPLIRYYKIFNTPVIGTHTEAVSGLTLDEIYILGICYLGHFLEDSRAIRILDVQIPGLTKDHVDRFLAFTSLSRNDLASRLRAEHKLDEGFSYRYSSLREFPLVRISYQGREEVHCPVPTLLFWRFTSGLYYTLKDAPGFFEELGRSFQRYVGEVLQQRITSAGRAVLAEEEYHVGRDRKHTVDWIVQQGDEAALFIECKIKRLTWASKAALADLTALQADLDTLAAAVVQVYKTIADYRAGHYPNLLFVEARQVFPMVVTLEDWYFFGREMPALLEASVKAKMVQVGLPEAWLGEMPYAILSVHELERVARYFNEIDLPMLVLGRTQDPEYSHWGFSAYCAERYGKDRPALPPLFRQEYDAMFGGLGR